MKRIEIEIECSQFTPGRYWVFGSEYYAVKGVIEVPDDLDTDDLTDDELSEMADNGEQGVRWANGGEAVQP